jgi:hypothetical protein
VCPDGYVAIETQLAGGGRDLFISVNVEAGSTPSSSTVPSVFEKESGARFEGDICLVRFDKSKKPKRVLFCRGRSLRIGGLLVRASDDRASFELDLDNREFPLVAGPAEAVAAVEVAGARLWPK